MPDRRLIWLGAALAAACLLFLTLQARGDWGFVLAFRGRRLLALAVVAASIATATAIFQTACGNRILTPSVMGFDALYLLLQTGLVFGLGGLGFASLDPTVKFAAELGLLMAAAILLFGTLLGREGRDLHRLVLTGIILGVLFRSLASFLQRLLDPAEFALVQGASFARFNRVEDDLLAVGSVLCVLCLGMAWRLRHRLDVLALGRETAIGLGLDHAATLRAALLLTAALVSVSTALVGPVAFFGLLVTSLAHALMRSHRHALLLPASALIAALALIGGQTLFEHVLGYASTLSVVVEFLGGLVFLFLLLGGRAR